MLLCYISFLSNVNSYLFFFNDTATTEIYTLSLHDALPISLQIAVVQLGRQRRRRVEQFAVGPRVVREQLARDRKSTRLNSSHMSISYAVFCLKKKNKRTTQRQRPESTPHLYR